MWHKSILDVVKRAEKRGMCFYGAGYWGEIAYRIFHKMNVSPLCYCDDDPGKIGKLYQGVPVYSLEESVQRYPNAVYIICVDLTKKPGNWGRDNFTAMLRRLKGSGVYDRNSELFLPMYLFLLDIENLDVFKEKILSQGNMKTDAGIIKADDIQNVLIFNHMSNSGAYYMEQLLDSHPDILSLPYINHSFWNVYNNRLRYLEGGELLIEMTAQMLGYLHSEYEDLYCVGHYRFEDYCVDKEGKFINSVLVKAVEFVGYLKPQFEKDIKLKSFAHMMKMYVAAYSNCLGKRKHEGKGYWLFYHMHKMDYDVSRMYDYFHKDEFKRIENLFIIREPIQQCCSWIRRRVMKEKRYMEVRRNTIFLQVLKCEMGINLEKKPGYNNVRVIRFEDLKYQSEATMKSLCRWLKIPYEEILSSTTLNGVEIYFPVYTECGVKYITGNDTTSVGQKDFSDILTLWDEARMNIIYAKFKEAYGYKSEVPDFLELSGEFLSELLRCDFRFASIVQGVMDEYGSEEEKYDVNEYVKNLYLNYMREYKTETEYYDYIRPERMEEK